MIARMLKPSDVLKPNADDQAAANMLETTVDAELRNYDGKPVEVRLPTNTPRRVIDLLVANYRVAGWLVDVLAPRGGLPSEVDPDFRLRFAIPSPPRSGPGMSTTDVMRRAAGEID
jgi:hypothetical protein